MNQLVVIAVCAIALGLVGSAYAHKSQVIGDYKIEVGWEHEPPVLNQPNAITVEVSQASEQDKENAGNMQNMTEQDAGQENTNMTAEEGHDHEEEKLVNGISGLADKLEVTITVNGAKTTLTLKEDSEEPGKYSADYTPTDTGYPNVHVFGDIKGTVAEATYHIEKIEAAAMEETHISSMSSDGSVNVSIGTVTPQAREPLAISLEFTDSSGKKLEHVNYDITATQDGTQVLSVMNGHTHTGADTQTTNALSSADPVDIKVTLKGQGLPNTDPSTWTGQKGDVVSFNVVPEFGPVSLIVLVASIAVILSVSVVAKRSGIIAKINYLR